MEELLGLVDYVLDTFGVIYTTLWMFWSAIFISFIGVYVSVKKFKNACTYAKAEIVGYGGGEYTNERIIMYVKILGTTEDIEGQTNIPLDENKYPVGSVIDVAYVKKSSDWYIIKLPDAMGDVTVKIFFIVQLLLLLTIAFLYIYSTFINPGFKIP
ncbi:hypothetical protein D6853_02930 [Butyrivibrio sp. X503]|uniref:hypothetical protein n=1 Tax=Butyrivibrio sp. X503 TaxID=2364878 RepID=UPI000EA886D7|nr:hypothetical protein [Butyrivibrio sp. X503]RKM56989.1 hypothetical protein D6853_02930 [Butyrivibrio sp. X503]